MRLFGRSMRSLLLRLLRKTFRILVIGLLGGYFIACLILYLAQEQLLFHPTILPHDFAYCFTQHVSEVFLPVDGASLSLVHFTQPNPKGVILYLHGNADTLQNADVFAERFIHRGYDVVLLDYRGYGKSTGSITSEESLHHDVQAVYTYVLQHYRQDQIILYGHSLGTGLAVRLAATTTTRMLILEAPYLSMRDLVAQKTPYIPLFLLKYQLRSDEWLNKVHCPIYLFHGTLDGVIPYDSSERLQTHNRALTHLTTIDGGGHTNLADFAAYQTALDEILH